MTPDELLARLIYRDALMLVLDKPAGIPVHKGTGGGETLEDHFDALRFGLPRLPALAHRLDRDTSGCLVLGRHRQALNRLGKLFSAGRVKKTYWALVEGIPAAEAGVIDLPLAKQNADKSRWQMRPALPSDGEEAQDAVTHYRLKGTHHNISWLELQPQTGRTHQLRVHCASQGWPIIGDKIYGKAGGVMQLHARCVEIPLYPGKDAIYAEASVPAAMAELLKLFEFNAV